MDRAFATAGQAVAEARHELIDRGWFGRSFASPAPQSPGSGRTADGQGERDIHGNSTSRELER